MLAYTPPFSLQSLLTVDFLQYFDTSISKRRWRFVTKCIGNGRTWLHKLGIEGESLLGSVTSMKHPVVMAGKEFQLPDYQNNFVQHIGLLDLTQKF